MATPTWQTIDAYLIARGCRVGSPTPGQTTGGIHADGSAHYDGRARDYGNALSDVKTISRTLAGIMSSGVIDELYDGANNIWFDQGKPYSPSTSERLGHMDHVHVSLFPGKSLDATTGSGTPAYGPTASPGNSGGAESKVLGFLTHETAVTLTKIGIGLILLLWSAATLLYKP